MTDEPVFQPPDQKEVTMKSYIYIIMVLMLISVSIGCFATMSSEERKETYDLRNVGESPFVGRVVRD